MNAAAEYKPGARDGSTGLLQLIETSLEDLRSLITCRICIRPLYEPYTIECGHTFCYSCLRQWFDRDRIKKTCPDCRSDVIRQPAPAYLVREVTQIFLSRAELVPVGETTEEHRRLQQEEAEIVELDKASLADGGGGLFRGRFRYFVPAPRRTIPAIRDVQDGVDRCPHCTWELEDGECGTCGYTVFADFRHGTDSLSGSASSSLSEILLEQQGGRSGLEDGGSDFDYFSETDISFADIARPYGGIDIEELASMGRIAARGRNRRRVLTETDEDQSNADDEDAGSLDGFVVNDGDDPPNSPGGETSIPGDWSPARGLSPRIGSSHIGSPSTHYDTDEITGIEEASGTNPSDYEDFPDDIPIGRIRGTRLGRIQIRAGQRRARARPIIENSGLSESDHAPAIAVRGSTQVESEDGSDVTPLVRSRRRARIERLSSSSGSDSAHSGMPTFRGPSLSRRNRQHNSSSMLARGFSPLHPEFGSNERGSGSSNGTSRGVPIEIESDSDSPVPPRRSRARRMANPGVSEEDRASDAGDIYSWTPSPQSSNGTATVGRRSPAHDTRMTPVPHQPGRTSNSISPILIGSSPIRTEDHIRPNWPRIPSNEISGSPLVSQDGTRFVRVPSPTSTDRYNTIPPRHSPRPHQRTRRIPSRSPRQPPSNIRSSGSPNPPPRQPPTNEALSGHEQRRQRAASTEAVRKAARKAEKKRQKRERRQREQTQPRAANVAGEAFGRRW